MIVVAIIGVVSSIAYPSYQGYLSDTYRAQAAADLKVCGMALERFYSNSFSYIGAVDKISVLKVGIPQAVYLQVLPISK